MGKKSNNFIPAFRFDWLTPLFDPFLSLTMREYTFKHRLVKEAFIRDNNRILDLGCGTGTLVMLIKEVCPSAEVIGIDADEQILQIASSKIMKAGLNISLDKGLASNLPYTDESFDLVVSSLMFHHLTRENKNLALNEVYRIIRPTGCLLIADFGHATNKLMYLVSLFMRNFEQAADNYKGLLPQMIRKAGFVQVETFAYYSTFFGTLCLYKGYKPSI